MRNFSTRMVVMQIILVVLFCGFQTTVWPSLLGHIQSPQLWLPWLIFLALYRPFFEALFIGYFYGLIMLAFTSLSLQMVWPIFLIMVATCAFAKNKVFWPGLRYFTLACGLACFAWNVCVVVLSYVIEKRSAPPMIVSRILESLLTTFASPAVYGAMIYLERFRPDEYSSKTPSEAEL